MGSVSQTFSDLSAGLTNLNKRLAVNVPLGKGVRQVGPLGFSEGRTRIRQELDKTLSVSPREGDPGYVPPAEPVLTPVTPLVGNDPTDLNIIAARRRSIEDQLRRRGRMSTVISNPQNEPLGG